MLFNTSSVAYRSTSLLTRISLDQYLASKQIFSPLEISIQPQVGRQTQVGWIFFQMIWYLGRCAHFKGSNASSKEIQLIEWSLCVCTFTPRFLNEDRTLFCFPAARSSSNSPSNIPRYDDNESIIYIFFPKIIFAIYIWTSNPWEPQQLYYLLLTPTFFFTESTDQRLKYIFK